MAVLSQAFLELLACPESHGPLSLASEAEVAALKHAVEAGTATRRDGSRPSLTFDGALWTEGRRAAYLIEDGIPNLLVDERLELNA